LSNESLLTKLDKYNNLFINEKRLLNSSKNTIITYSSVLNSFYEFILGLSYINKEVILKFINKDILSANFSKILYLAVIKAYLIFIDEKAFL